MSARQLPPRFEGETQKAYAALADYLALGPGRSVEKLLHKYRSGAVGNPPTLRAATLDGWAMSCAWELRAAAWDKQRKEAPRDATASQ